MEYTDSTGDLLAAISRPDYSVLRPTAQRPPPPANEAQGCEKGRRWPFLLAVLFLLEPTAPEKSSCAFPPNS